MCVCKSLLIIGAHLNVLACLQACRCLKWVLELNFGEVKKNPCILAPKKSLHFGPNPCILDPMPFWGSKDLFKNTKCRDLGQKCRDLGQKGRDLLFSLHFGPGSLPFFGHPCLVCKKAGIGRSGSLDDLTMPPYSLHPPSPNDPFVGKH